MPNQTTVSATVILAGGQSSRMGKAKALLALPNNKTLLDFHITHAKKLGLPILLADNGKNFGKEHGISTVFDYLPSDSTGKGAGALSAICGALLSVSDGYLLVSSCDSLVPVDQLWLHLQKHAETEVVYLKNHKDYPLLGLYHGSILEKLRRYLDDGERSVMKFLESLTVTTVPAPDNWQHLLNFNTQNEFETAIKILNQQTRRSA